MIVYSVTKDNPESIDRIQLFATKELAEAMAKRWVEEDKEQCVKDEAIMRETASPEYLALYDSIENKDEWRWVEDGEFWGYGKEYDGRFSPIYTIYVAEMEVNETLPQ